MRMKKYDCYLECDAWEQLDIAQLFYEIKEFRLIEVVLDNWYSIKQRKDIPMTYDTEWASYDMKPGVVYCTSWNNVLESVRTWWGENELKERIETCENYI